MRQYSQTSKQNLKSIVNQKNSIMKMKSNHQQEYVSKPLHLTSHTSSISNLHQNHKKLTNKGGILHKFIQNGSRYQTNSRRQSIQSQVSRVSLSGLNKFMEDTTNYSDQIKTLKERNKQLIQQNKELRRMIDGDKIRLSNVSSQKSVNLNSFDFVNLLQDSNNILKRKFQQSRKTIISNLDKDRIGNKQQKYQSTHIQIDKLYSKGFKQCVFPSVTTLIKIIEDYVKQFDNIFIKVKFLAEHVKQSSNDYRLDQLNQLMLRIKNSIIYRNKSDIQNKGSESKSNMDKRLKSKTKSSRKMFETSILETFAPQLLSPQDTFKMLQKLLQKITKSCSMLETFRQKSLLHKLVRKLL